MTGARAGWWPRAGAMLIDGLILTAVALAVGILISAAGASGDDATLTIYGVVFLASVVYGPVMMARPGAVNGQTVGKQALGLRVIHADGGAMTLQRGLMRDGVGKALLGLVPLYTISDVLVPLFDAQKQAIHDKVGRTFVVPVAAVPTPSAHDPSPPETHAAWTAPSQPPPAPPPPARPPAPAPPGAPAPPPAPPRAGDPPPDLGGFAPPVAPGSGGSAPAPAAEDDEVRGPFGPTHD